jgi:excinuclease ABC subunit A
VLLQKGFTRILDNGNLVFIEEAIEKGISSKNPNNIQILIDRSTVNHEDEDNRFRCLIRYKLPFTKEMVHVL